ncbi:hypothetical protein QYE76_030164 [Lolium multiflorum]|uniref:Uncharacterized protein n=1 Tax=Lolium multiflorum TaxID=4521 RepID=A0AAD8QQN2_LOLMU|nr:hypothetical protein QYE76_030164 [Lolium multiflorum]
MQGVVCANMFDSCFAPFKLHYDGTKKFAAGDFVCSDVSHAGGHPWRIKCYPRGHDKADKGEYISLFLQFMGKSKGVKAISEAFVVDKEGVPFSPLPRRFMKVYAPAPGLYCWGWPKFAKRRDLEYVVNGWITIVYGVIVLRGEPLPGGPSSGIANDLGHLLDSADGSDVSFIVDGKTFPAHRAVLAARSPVFKAELFGSMAESTMSHITLQDIDPAAFKVFLRFIYTDTLPRDDELKEETYKHLLAVADRYVLDGLKLLCAQKLWDNVTTDTVAATLCHAETYSCLDLKNKCIAFFAKEKNFREAVLTDGFVELVHKFPSIIAELREKAKK